MAAMIDFSSPLIMTSQPPLALKPETQPAGHPIGPEPIPMPEPISIGGLSIGGISIGPEPIPAPDP